MDWIEVTLSTTTLAADLVSEALMRFGAKGTQIIDRADVPDPDKPGAYWELIDQSLIDDMPPDVQVKAWFDPTVDMAPLGDMVAGLPALAGFALGTLAIAVNPVDQKDWAEYWKRFYKPFRLGKRIVVVPSWEAYAVQPEDLIISLDPGLAFGTGTHETTALCVELIERYYAGGAVLDLGCGSGILALAAARLGARDVLAVDIDPMAVRTAGENIIVNGLQAQVRAVQGDLLQGMEQRFDLAVANILADVIISLGEPMRRAVAPGGVFICSGIILSRAADVEIALRAAGFTLLEQRCRGEWAAFAWRVPGGA